MYVACSANGDKRNTRRPVDQDVGGWMTLRWVTFYLRKIFGNP
jgi:hypothetical protein